MAVHRAVRIQINFYPSKDKEKNGIPGKALWKFSYSIGKKSSHILLEENEKDKVW